MNILNKIFKWEETPDSGRWNILKKAGIALGICFLPTCMGDNKIEKVYGLVPTNDKQNFETTVNTSEKSITPLTKKFWQ